MHQSFYGKVFMDIMDMKLWKSLNKLKAANYNLWITVILIKIVPF